MKTTMKILTALLVAGLAYGQQPASVASSSTANEESGVTQNVFPQPPTINPFGSFQTLGFIQSVDDHKDYNTRLYLFLKQARFGVNGNYDDVKYEFQLALGGEDGIKTSPGVSLSLLDLDAEIPLSSSFFVKAGQFKVPYSREELTNSRNLLFADRSIDNLAFKLGRDVGAAVYSVSGDFTGVLGVFTGGGRDVPVSYLPENIGIPMTVLRVGLNHNYDKNVFDLSQTSYNAANGWAFFVNGLYVKDSKVGHSTAMNVKLADKSLLLDANWNPYISESPIVQGKLWQTGIDAAYRTTLSETASLSGEVELNHGAFTNAYGTVQSTGGRAQAGIYEKPYEIGLRYAFIRPDANFAVTSNGKTVNLFSNTDWIHQVTFAASYYLKDDRVKITADIPVLFGVPVVNDPISGAYVVTQQPDQVTYITSAAPNTATISRQTVVSAQLQLQVTLY
jgi:hypothetical protein